MTTTLPALPAACVCSSYAAGVITGGLVLFVVLYLFDLLTIGRAFRDEE